MLESTFLSRSFSDQGVRLRIRKEHRVQMYAISILFYHVYPIFTLVDIGTVLVNVKHPWHMMMIHLQS